MLSNTVASWIGVTRRGDTLFGHRSIPVKQKTDEQADPRRHTDGRQRIPANVLNPGPHELGRVSR